MAFRAAICEKSFVNDVAVTEGTDAEALGLLELLDGEPLLPQAARTRAAPPATAVSPALLVTEYNQTTSLVGGERRSAPHRQARHDGHCLAGNYLGEQ
jgi:hypothetical protein